VEYTQDPIPKELSHSGNSEWREAFGLATVKSQGLKGIAHLSNQGDFPVSVICGRRS